MRIIKWFLLIFMALVGVGALSDKQIFPGIIVFLTVILLSLKRVSTRVKIGGFLIGFIVFAITLDKTDTSQPAKTPEQKEFEMSQNREIPENPHNDSKDNENGWKNFKWGMTLKEVLKVYKDIQFLDWLNFEKKCSGEPYLDKFGWEIDIERNKNIYSEDIFELLCGDSSERLFSGMFFYKGKFFCKVVHLSEHLDDEKKWDIIIKQLQEKYPDGEISYMYKIKDGETIEYGEDMFGNPFSHKNESFSYKHETEVDLIDKFSNSKKIPVFEYKSNQITVFINKSFDLYFYDTKVLNELIRKGKESQKKIEDNETGKIKQLF